MEILKLFPTALGIHEDKEMSDKIYPIAKNILDDKQNLTYAWNYKNTYHSPSKIESLPQTQFICSYF